MFLRMSHPFVLIALYQNLGVDEKQESFRPRVLQRIGLLWENNGGESQICVPYRQERASQV